LNASEFPCYVPQLLITYGSFDHRR
jgi:hypothetical protein